MPDAKSGYYWIYVKGKKKEVFCDMLNYGMTGKTVKYSFLSDDHLRTPQCNKKNVKVL